MPDDGTGGVRSQIVAIFPVIVWPNWPGTKTTAAIRANIAQNAFDAVAAESALERANHRFGGIRRKFPVAILTGGSQFEHKCFGVGAEDDSVGRPGPPRS